MIYMIIVSIVTECQSKLEPKPTKSVAVLHATDFQYTQPENAVSRNNRNNKIGCINFFLLALQPKASDFVTFYGCQKPFTTEKTPKIARLCGAV